MAHAALSQEDSKMWPKSGKKVIVKVQLPVFRSDGDYGMALMYDQKRSFCVEFQASEQLVKAMGAASKRRDNRGYKSFFSGKYVPDREGGEHKYKIELICKVVDRNW